MSAAPPQEKPSVVQVVKDGDGWRLLRDGRPYFIKGAGGDGDRKALAASLPNAYGQYLRELLAHS